LNKIGPLDQRAEQLVLSVCTLTYRHTYRRHICLRKNYFFRFRGP